MPIKKVSVEEIIKKSKWVFHEKGYHKTSMADIAEACGLLKGSIYHHFKGKEDLMRAVIEHLHQVYIDEYFAVAYREDISGEEKLKLYEQMAENLFYNHTSGCFMGNIALETATANPVFVPALRAFFDDWIKAITRVYEERYTKKQAKELAVEAISELEGAIMLMRLYQDDKYVRKVNQKIIKRYRNAPAATIK